MKTFFDLMDLVVAAEGVRRKLIHGSSKTAWRQSTRHLLEVPANLIGLAVGALLRLLPWSVRSRMDLRINVAMRAHAPADTASRDRALKDSDMLWSMLRETRGVDPALLILTSHPPTAGDTEWLRFELLNQGLVIAQSLCQKHQRNPQIPECLLAIDPFALDTLPPFVAGMYSGLMHAAYFVYDRQAHTQHPLQKAFFLRNTGPGFVAWRLLARLKKGVPVLMALSGGVPSNSRLMYTLREFVKYTAAHAPNRPVRFSDELGEWMRILTTPVRGHLSTIDGSLASDQRTQLMGRFRMMGYSPTEAAYHLIEFEEEYRRDDPYRRRLFDFFVRRLLRAGKPLLILGSRATTQGTVHWSGAWGIDVEDGELIGTHVQDGVWSQSHWLLDHAAEAFSKRVVSAIFDGH